MARRNGIERGADLQVIKLLVLMLLLLAITTLGAAEARHPHPCSSAVNVKNSLDMRFDETVRYGGITGKLIVKMYVSDSGTWTLVYISPDGAESCIMAAGDKWHDVPWQPGKKS